MIFMRIAVICVLSGLFFPSTVLPQQDVTKDAINEEEVKLFLDRYVDRYKSKSIDLFMELFSRDAVENRVLPYADIRRVYEKIFAETNQFLYYLTLDYTESRKGGTFVSGKYKLIQTLKKDNKMKAYQGNIQFYLVREGEAVKIKELNYGRTLVNY